MVRFMPACAAGGLAAVLLIFAAPASADIKIGVIYDHTGAFAAGGSKAAAIGNKIAIDMINEKGGVEGHKIVAIEADAQSKTDVAINEAERLLNDAKVDLLMGDPTKARTQLGWKPRVTFEELVQRMYEHDLADEAARAGR